MDATNSKWLSADEPHRVWDWLVHHTDWAREATFVGVESAGQGNMNVVMRVRTRVGSIIVKQARPYVAKYPSIAAPLNRILFEGRFYELIGRESSLAQRMPRNFGLFADDHILLCEDLAPGRDASYLYHDSSTLSVFEVHLETLIDWLAHLHRWSRTIDRRDHFANDPLRRLNEEHLAQVPFQEPPLLDLDGITPGLGEVAAAVRRNRRVVDRCAELGAIYLVPGDSLLHGDFFPGSWYEGQRGIAVIDPEFCYFGRAEFDVGVMLGHLVLIAGGATPLVEMLLARYRQTGSSIDPRLTLQFAGLEVLRRLLGVAQLPLSTTLDGKCHAIEWAMGQLAD